MAHDKPLVVEGVEIAKYWTDKGVYFASLPRTFSAETLFKFNKTHGSSPLNYIPDGPVREHFDQVNWMPPMASCGQDLASRTR